MAKTLEDFVSAALKVVTEIEPEDVMGLVKNEGFRIIDVREPDEFAEGHLPGSYNIPRGFLEVRADLEHYKQDPSMQDRHQKLICYCGGGHRSALAAQTLLEMGFKEVRSLRGGWTEWEERGMPVER